MNKELQEILKLEGFKILKIDERKEKTKIIKVIYVESNNKKQECPSCGNYTSSIHDKLKPIELKYLKVIEQDTKINIIKKRFICHNCNKKFTENVKLSEAPSYGMPITLYDPRSKGAKSYEKFTREFLKINEEEQKAAKHMKKGE